MRRTARKNNEGTGKGEYQRMKKKEEGHVEALNEMSKVEIGI